MSMVFETAGETWGMQDLMIVFDSLRLTPLCTHMSITLVLWIASRLTLKFQPSGSHGPIRFVLTSSAPILIGLLTLLAEILVSRDLQSTVVMQVGL